MLLSRRGADAPDAEGLRAELEKLGAQVEFVACDIADRAALAGVLDAMPEDQPLTTVVHTAGVLDEGKFVAESANPLSRLSRVMAAKAGGAAHLHELLQGHPVETFLLFSSAAGVWGTLGQAGYAAANAYLDGLAQHRRAAGLPATSIAWGAWAGGGGMLSDRDAIAWLGGSGMRLMDPAAAVAAMQRMVEGDEPVAVVADVDWPRFSEVYNAARPRPLISGLTAAEAPGEDGTGAPDGADPGTAQGPTEAARRLAGLPPARREAAVLDVVREAVAGVLGHGTVEEIDPERSFRELGLESVAGLELRNRLGSATGLRLTTTMIFDHPSPLALARHLVERLAEETGAVSVTSPLDALERLAHALASAPPEARAGEEITRRLRQLAEQYGGGSPLPAPEPEADAASSRIESASDDEIFAIIDSH